MLGHVIRKEILANLSSPRRLFFLRDDALRRHMEGSLL